MSRRPYRAEGGAIFPRKNSPHSINGRPGSLPCDISGFRAEHSVGFDTTATGGGEPPELLQMILCVHKQQVRIGCSDCRTATDTLQQSGALQVLLQHGHSDRTFRVVSGLVTLKAGI